MIMNLQDMLIHALQSEEECNHGGRYVSYRKPDERAYSCIGLLANDVV